MPDDLSETPRERLGEAEVPGGPSHGRPPFAGVSPLASLLGSHSEHWRKTPPASNRVKEIGIVLKYTRALCPSECMSSGKTAERPAGVLPEPNWAGQGDARLQPPLHCPT